MEANLNVLSISRLRFGMRFESAGGGTIRINPGEFEFQLLAP